MTHREVGPDARSATQEASARLSDWHSSQTGTDESASIKREDAKARHSADALQRPRRRIAASGTPQRSPRHTCRTHTAPVGATPGESAPTEPADLWNTP